MSEPEVLDQWLPSLALWFDPVDFSPQVNLLRIPSGVAFPVPVW